MSKNAKIVAVLCCACALPAMQPSTAQSNAEQRHRITVADTIRMTSLLETNSAGDATLGGRYARFSPDGKRFVVATQKGNPETNENDYSLLLFDTANVFEDPKPKLLVSLASRSNREGIKNVKWRDNETVYFIGEAHETAQVYSINIDSQRLIQCTQHPTALVDFDVDEAGDLVYAADPEPPREEYIAERIGHGFVVTTETLGDIPQNKAAFREPSGAQGEEVFIQRRGEKAIHVVLRDRYVPLRPISLAPTGDRAVFAVVVRDVPPVWGEYDSPLIQAEVRAYRRAGTTAWIMRYMLVDLKTGNATPLLAGPIESGSAATAWSSDGTKIVVSGAFLPLADSDPAEREARRKHAFAVAVDVQTGRFEKISEEGLVVARWDKKSHQLYFRGAPGASATDQKAYTKSPSGWVEVEPRNPEMQKSELPEVTLDQGLNTPPKLFASDPEHARKTMLLDPNPQFAEFEFGTVKAVQWKASDGHEVEGDLYLPPDYRKGPRYPLVIQTHASTRTEFWINGPWNSAFAAQPLAAQGIVVLQIGHGTESGGYMSHHRSLEEGPREMAAYEGAIDYLDRLGIVDRGRVGIIGFSRTQYHVEYTLTHSSYSFAAVTLADGFDGSYLQYLANPYSEKDYVFVNGGPPFGATFANWLEHSPSFRLDRLHMPVRIESYRGGIVGSWELFSVLTHLGRPAELVYLPDAAHLLVKPWERLTSQQGNVDWFSFWLKGEEDPDPSKGEQYVRWRAMGAARSTNRKHETR